MSQMQRDLFHILPQLIVLLSAVGGLILEMLRKPKATLWLISAGMAAALAVSVSRTGMVTTAFSETFRVDALNHWAVIILGSGNILFMLLARSELKKTPREGTVYSLLTFSALGAMLLAGSGDLMFIVLGILMVGLSGFALAAYPKTRHATEGAMKYFIYGSITGAVMLFGLTYWVGISGSTLIADIAKSEPPLWAMAVGFVALLTGTGYAASIFPFHFWTPDTLQGAPVSVAAYLSVTPKIGAVFALAQVARDLPVELFNWQLIIGISAALSMTFGNVLALLQNNVVRLLAYSTVAQAGYFLLAVVAIPFSTIATEALIVFGLAYLLMNTGAFAIVLSRGRSIDELRGLARSFPLTAVALTVFLLSLTGIPPLAGFAGKFLLFASAIDAGFTWLALIAIINSVISLAVYLRIIAPAFFHKNELLKTSSEKITTKAVWLFCLLGTIIAGIFVRLIIP